nr:MAG TPA: hypothetical protein [Caudoviricetes sp.]DAK89962.1 MAG TPA: hypothetical protein [Caudoviricetes sp.]DAP54475.1 MAG TPA: hypothetical protein [Caudoviricetes sp.]
MKPCYNFYNRIQKKRSWTPVYQTKSPTPSTTKGTGIL